MTLATRDLLAVWRTLDLDDARAATDVLLPTARDLAGTYGEIAAVTAADFYDDARAAANVPGRFRARTAATAPVDQVDALTRWAVTPLWSTGPRYGAALSRLSGELSRMTLQPARDTVWESTRREGIRYAVVPQSDACDWCTMLASRGAVYHTARTARTSMELGRQREYHDRCRCVTQPVWTEDDLPEINRRLHAEWQEYASGAPDPRAAWREHIASRN